MDAVDGSTMLRTEFKGQMIHDACASLHPQGSENLDSLHSQGRPHLCVISRGRLDQDHQRGRFRQGLAVDLLSFNDGDPPKLVLFHPDNLVLICKHASLDIMG